MAACDKGGKGNEVCCVNSTMVESHELGDQGRLPGRGDISATRLKGSEGASQGKSMRSRARKDLLRSLKEQRFLLTWLGWSGKKWQELNLDRRHI